MNDLNLKRPSIPNPCSPMQYQTDKSIILSDVRQAIQFRRWEYKDLHKYYPSIRRKTFEHLMDGEDFRFSARFAYSAAEAVGVDPFESLARARRSARLG